MPKKNPRKMFEDINAVEGFSPSDLYKEKIGKNNQKYDALSVNDKLNWFHLKHPNGRVVLTKESEDSSKVVFCASVYAEMTAESLIGTGYAVGYFSNDAEEQKNIYSSTQSYAVSKALQFAGFHPITDCDDGSAEPPNEVEKKPVISPVALTEAEVLKTVVPCFDTLSADELKSRVEELLDDLRKSAAGKARAGGTLITFGPMKNKTVKEVSREEKNVDKVARLREYSAPDYSTLSINDALCVAAASLYVEEFDKKVAASGE